MFVDVPLIKHNEFYMKSEKDLELREMLFDGKQRNSGYTGVYAHLVPDWSLHPLYVHEHKSQIERYGRISLSNRTSRLKRDRKFKKVWYDSWVDRGEDESWESYCSRHNKIRKTKQIIAYGSGDSPEQILERFDMLNRIPDRFFVISMSAIFKKDEPSDGGFRQHKNGPYIGSKEMKYEYFAQEGDEFEYIITYHIHEVSFGCDYKVIETENFKIMIEEDADRHFFATIFDKDDAVVSKAWRADDNINIIVGDVNEELFTVLENKETMFQEIDTKLIKLVEKFNNETI